jgi:WD40 repeat protein
MSVSRRRLQDDSRRTGEVRAVVPTPWPVYGVDSADDGTRAVVLGGGGWGVLDLTDLTRRDSLDVTADLDPWTRMGTGTSLAEVAPDGDRVALLGTESVMLVDLDTTEVLERRTIESEPNVVQSAAWTPDGSALAVGTTAGWFHVLDGDGLEPLAPRRQVTSGVLTNVEVSPDGTTAATIGPEGDVTLWDTATWRPYGQPLFDDQVTGFLHFSRDGERLEAWLNDGTRSVVSVEPRAWIEAACAIAARDLTTDEWAVVRPGVEPRSTCDRDETRQ